MKQTSDVRPKMSDEDRKALRLFRLSAFVAGVVAIAVATGFGFALRPFLHWDADRTGAERRAQERLQDIEEAAAKREADLLHVFEGRKQALEDAIAANEKRSQALVNSIRENDARLEKSRERTFEAEQELANREQELKDGAPAIAKHRSEVSSLEHILQQLQETRRSLEVSNRVLTATYASTLKLLSEKNSDIEQSKKEYDSVYRNLVELRSQKQTVEGKLDEVNHQLSNKQDALGKIEEQISVRGGVLKKLEESRRNLNSLTNNLIPKARNDLKEAKTAKQSAEADKDNLKAELEQLQREIESKQKDLSNAENHLADLKIQIRGEEESLQVAKDKRMKAVADEERIRRAIDSMKDQEEALSRSIADKNAEADNIRNEVLPDLDKTIREKNLEIRRLEKIIQKLTDSGPENDENSATEEDSDEGDQQ